MSANHLILAIRRMSEAEKIHTCDFGVSKHARLLLSMTRISALSPRHSHRTQLTDNIEPFSRKWAGLAMKDALSH